MDNTDRVLAGSDEVEGATGTGTYAFPATAYYAGDATLLGGLAVDAVGVSEESGNLTLHVLALQAVGLAHLTAGRWGEAADTLARALSEARQQRVGLFEEASVLGHRALAQLGVGDEPAAATTADEAVAVARRQGAKVMECEALLSRARVLRRSEVNGRAVQEDLASAVAVVRQTEAFTYEPFIQEELGRLHRDEKELHEALGLYRQIGATGHARRLDAELSMRATP